MTIQVLPDRSAFVLTIHTSKHLCHNPLFHFPLGTLALWRYGVDLIDENDAWSELAGFIKYLSHFLLRLSRHARHNRRSRYRYERYPEFLDFSVSLESCHAYKAHTPAIALASIVLPQPGGPCSSTPLIHQYRTAICRCRRQFHLGI